MIQDHLTLLLCLFVLVIAAVVYQYYEINKTKKATVMQLELLSNQIAEENYILEQKNKEALKFEVMKKDLNQKLVTLKTDIITIHHTFSELFELILER